MGAVILEFGLDWIEPVGRLLPIPIFSAPGPLFDGFKVRVWWQHG